MSEQGTAFEEAWRRFAAAFDAGENALPLEELQDWIDAWDACFWRRDFSGFPAAYWPEVEIENHVIPFFDRSHSGIESFAQLREELADILANFRFEIHEMAREGPRFAALGRLQARWRYAGLLRFPNAVVWTYRDGKIARVDSFPTHRGALAKLRD